MGGNPTVDIVFVSFLFFIHCIAFLLVIAHVWFVVLFVSIRRPKRPLELTLHKFACVLIDDFERVNANGPARVSLKRAQKSI